MPGPTGNGHDPTVGNGHPKANGAPAAADTPPHAEPARNVLGGELRTCCTDPVTGFYRNGRCDTGPDDLGSHTVCAVMTEEFLAFTAEQGNDLSTPHPHFPGLKPGDRWCLCAVRWEEARLADVAPLVDLEATHERALDIIEIDDLREHAAD